jgi:hypothetical protein
MRKPVQPEASKLHVIPKLDDREPDPPQPVAGKRKAGCAPELEIVRGRILNQWLRGVRMKSLAVIYCTTKDEIETVLRDRIELVAPALRRAA